MGLLEHSPISQGASEYTLQAESIIDVSMERWNYSVSAEKSPSGCYLPALRWVLATP